MAARRSFRRTANSRGAILGTASARRTQTQHGKPSTRCITGFADNAQQFWWCHWLCRRSSHQGGSIAALDPDEVLLTMEVQFNTNAMAAGVAGAIKRSDAEFRRHHPEMRLIFPET